MQYNELTEHQLLPLVHCLHLEATSINQSGEACSHHLYLCQNKLHQVVSRSARWRITKTSNQSRNKGGHFRVFLFLSEGERVMSVSYSFQKKRHSLAETQTKALSIFRWFQGSHTQSHFQYCCLVSHQCQSCSFLLETRIFYATNFLVFGFYSCPAFVALSCKMAIM